MTLIPGILRFIEDKKGYYYGAYEYYDTDKMYVHTGEKKAPVIHDKDGWRFSINSDNDAIICCITKNGRVKGFENGYDTENMFTVYISEKIDPVWYPLIFGMPMISFL